MPKLAKRGRPSRVGTTPSSSRTSATRRGTTSINAIAGITSNLTSYHALGNSSDDDDEKKYDDATTGVINGTSDTRVTTVPSRGASSSISTTTTTGTHRPVSREASSNNTSTTAATGKAPPVSTGVTATTNVSQVMTGQLNLLPHSASSTTTSSTGTPAGSTGRESVSIVSSRPFISNGILIVPPAGDTDTTSLRSHHNTTGSVGAGVHAINTHYTLSTTAAPPHPTSRVQDGTTIVPSLVSGTGTSSVGTNSTTTYMYGSLPTQYQQQVHSAPSSTSTTSDISNSSSVSNGQSMFTASSLGVPHSGTGYTYTSVDSGHHSFGAPPPPPPPSSGGTGTNPTGSAPPPPPPPSSQSSTTGAIYAPNGVPDYSYQAGTRVQLPWSVKFNGAVPILTDTAPLRFAKWKREFESYLSVSGASTMIQCQFADNLYTAELCSGVMVHHSQYLLRFMVQQVHQMVLGTLVSALGNYSEAIQNEFIKVVQDKKVQLLKSGVIDTTRTTGEWDVHTMYQLVLQRYERKTIYSSATLYARLFNSAKWKHSAEPHEVVAALMSIDKQLSSLGDKPVTGTTIPEGLLIHILLSLIPEEYGIKNSIIASPSLSFGAIVEAMIRYRELAYRGALPNNASLRQGKANSAVTESQRSGSAKAQWKQSGKRNKYRGTKGNRSPAPHGSYSKPHQSIGSGNERHAFVVWAQELPTSDSEYAVESSNDEDDGTAHSAVAKQSSVNSALPDGTYYGRANEWILDSGATIHVSNAHYLKEKHRGAPLRITFANKASVDVSTYGTVDLSTTVTLNNVAYIRNAGANLVSLSRIIDSGYLPKFSTTKCEIQRQGATIITFKRVGALYIFTRGGVENDTGTIEWNKSMVYKEPRIPRLSQRTEHTSATSSSSSTHAHRSGYIDRGAYPAHSRNQQTPTTNRNDARHPSSDSRRELELSRSQRAAATIAPASSTGATSRNTASAHSVIGVPTHNYDITQSDPRFQNRMKAAINGTHHVYIATAASIWHSRMGHQGRYCVDKVNGTYKLNLHKNDIAGTRHALCESCLFGQGRRSQISTTPTASMNLVPATKAFDRVWCDVKGPISGKLTKGTYRISTPSGAIYYAVNGDEYTKFWWVKLLQYRSDATKVGINFQKMVHTQYDTTVKEYHTDGGGEFMDRSIQDVLESFGTKHTYTTRDSPQHNGTAERAIQSLTGMARSMLHHCGAPHDMWGEAVIHATYIHNRTPLASLEGITPYQALYHRVPDISKLRVFGCNAYIRIPKMLRGQLDARYMKGVYVGVSEQHNACRIYIPGTNKVYYSRDVRFAESSFTFAQGTEPRTSRTRVSVPPSGDREVPATDLMSESLAVPRGTTNLSGPTQLVPLSAMDYDYTNDGLDLGGHNSDEETSDGDHLHHSVSDEGSTPIGDTTDTIDNTRHRSSVSSNIRNDSDVTTSEIAYPDTPGEVIHLPTPSHTTTRSGRTSQPVWRLGMRSEEDYLHYTTATALAAKATGPEPQSYKKAMLSPNSGKWRRACDIEHDSIVRMMVYDLVHAPKGAKVLKSRWVFKEKHNELGATIKYKARWVLRGDMQEYGVNFFDTYAPVAMLKSIKLVLCLAAQFDLELYQLDFDTAFLNAPVQETVYVEQPEGYNDGTDRVCKLNKALYGLKQAPMCWNTELNQAMISLGYEPCKLDPCIYVKRTALNGTACLIIACIYVDDTVVACSSSGVTTWLHDKKKLGAMYAIKDLGNCEWILNMSVKRDRTNRTITLSQHTYISRMLEKFDLVHAKAVPNPGKLRDITVPLDGSQPVPLVLDGTEHKLYRSILGALLYAANTTRLDIAYIVGALCRHVAAPMQHHVECAKHVLRYLSGTMHHAMEFSGGTSADSPTPHMITAYSDADWAGDKTTRRSTTGAMILYNGKVISWVSKRQECVALSTAEAEYLALATVTKEVLWYKAWLNEVLRTVVPPVPVYCDNQAAVAISGNGTGNNQKTKHIDIRYHFIQDEVKYGTIEVQWVPTDQQLADILTKVLTTVTLNKFVNQLLVNTVSGKGSV
jgi:hypothetical protein